ncbi:hypothetical protein RE428_11840 [Marinobacter nanhaiticus D15-8W]|uniref:FAD-binding FR-type domain-containing protein n=1 Tax=Marinobacter nanhaiticus D15-8W TaxID=626887 RepID=N6WVF5_9GAMM|nr:FAD-binding oxidoreductase [Marinobacter nanhaiticus]ENO12818.1 hypothetical protein J057_15510 [Marinobacter nanhaiticus D15-8W]BES70166.1 hypothetical protein RE428_11840 [Marinobacter nanhaiticus D15-8W]
MANESDIRRARKGAEDNLAVLETLSGATESSVDSDLKLLLAGISRRRSDQTLRLLDWVNRHEVAGPVLDAPANSDRVSRSESPQVAGDAVARPATAAEGVPVLARRDVTPELIQFTVPRPQDFNFIAGQSVKVGIGGIRRSFSLVSAPHEPVLEFFVELVPGGQMSEQLRRMRVGERVALGPPKGGLRLDPGFPNHLMVSTVTGINPFISILRDYLHQGRTGHRFHLLQGASYQNEFGYREELERLAAAHPEVITYVPTVSRPDEPANQGWSGETGRVDTQVVEYLRRAGLDSGSTLAYACGHSGMLDAVGRQLVPLGFQLSTENYD